MSKSMKILPILVFVSLSATVFPISAEDNGEPKAISGMSILGNNETPKSLYIVPWKSSDVGMENDLSSNLLNESLTPVDKDVLMREVDFYEISTAK